MTRAFAALIVVAALTGGCGSDGGGRPSVGQGPDHLILITVDTFRGDHFLAERGGEPLTPRLAELASRSIVFPRAHSVGDCTSPGTAGIFTGLYPARSGVIRNAHMLPKTLPTLATVLRGAGFTTAGFVSNPVLDRRFGFGHGFSTYERLDPVGRKSKVRGKQVTAPALEWLDGVDAGERVFLWLHYMEPHGPYEPPPGKRALFPPTAFEAEGDIPLQPSGVSSGKGAIPDYQQLPDLADASDGREYEARYAAEVRALDDELGRLLDALDGRGWLDDAVLVLTSDHGEALTNDHGYYFSHQNGVTQDQVHVPLLLHHPGVAEGRVEERPVSTLDVMPTVLDLLGVPSTLELDGRSLLDASGGLVVSQSRKQIAVRDGAWKLRRVAAEQWSLVDLDADPAEARDVSERQPVVLERLRAELEEVHGLTPLAPSVERPTR